MSSAKWRPLCLVLNVLTHCGQVTHTYRCRQYLMGYWCRWIMLHFSAYNGLSPERHQAIISAHSDSLWIAKTHFVIKIAHFSLKKVSSAKCQPFCLGADKLTLCDRHIQCIQTKYHKMARYMIYSRIQSDMLQSTQQHFFFMITATLRFEQIRPPITGYGVFKHSGII